MISVVDYGPRGDRKRGTVVFQSADMDEVMDYIENHFHEGDSDERYSVDEEEE